MSLICHIGFPKTGSTYLQKQIFPLLENIHYIEWEKDILKAFYRIIHYDDSYYNIKLCENILKQHTLNGVNLFSYEPLTGYHHHSRFSNRTQIAKRLKELNVSKIIITIRNQFDVLNSSYKQYVKNGGVMKIDKYLGLQPIREHSMLDKAYFDYYSIYKLYTKIFGVDNVLLLQYEKMKSQQYTDRICSFVGNSRLGDIKTEKVNASLSVNKTNLLRLVNHFSYSTHRPSQLITKKISTAGFFKVLNQMPGSGAKSYMTEGRKEIIANFYRQSNQRLAKEYNIDLHPSYPI